MPMAEDMRKFLKEAKVALDGNFFSQTYGNSDVLLQPNMRPYLYLQAYTPGGILHPSSEFFRTWILSTYSSLRHIPETFPSEDSVPYPGNTAGNCNSNEQSKWDELREHCEKSMRCYCGTRNDAISECDPMGKITTRDSIRIFMGVQQMLNLYIELARSDHAYDIRFMLGDAMELFFRYVQVCQTELSEDLKKLRGDEAQLSAVKDDVMALIEQADYSIALFRKDMNELLLDFLRSDRQFVETKTLLHVSVSSATKLIMGYAELMKEFIDVLRDKNEHDSNDCNYVLYLTCGGVQYTNAKKLFDFIEPNCGESKSRKLLEREFKIRENNLINVHLPERTLFRPGASIFNLLHESLHYVGYRDYKDRAIKMIASVSHYIARIWLYGLYRSSTDERKERVSRALRTLPKKKRNFIVKAFETRIDKAYEEKSARIFEKIRAELESKLNTNERNSSVLLSSNLPDRLLEICLSVFGPDDEESKKDAETADEIFSFQLLTMARADDDFAEAWKMIIEAADGRLLPIDASLYEGFLRRHAKTEDYTQEYQKLNGLFEPVFDSSGHVPEGFKDSVFLRHVHPLQEIIPEYIRAYREAFADAMACAYLNADPWEYLAAFLLENETPVYALAESPQTVLRIGCVLSVITDAAEDEDAACRRWKGVLNRALKVALNKLSKKHIVPGGADDEKRRELIAEYIAHIEALLKSYDEFYKRNHIAKPLEEHILALYRYHRKKAEAKIKCRHSIVAVLRTAYHDFMEGEGAADSWRPLIIAWMRTSCSRWIEQGEGDAR
jgi:hypothetical protein